MNAVNAKTPHSDEGMGPVRFAQRQEPDATGTSTVRVGRFDTAPTGQVLELLPRLTTWPAPGSPHCRSGVRGAGTVLDWLETVPGEGWQERWRNSGADGESKEWVDALVAACPERSPAAVHNEIIAGVSGLLLCRVLPPSYNFLIGYKAANLFKYARREFKPEVFARVEAAARERGMAGRHVAEVVTVLSKIVLHTGKDVDEITADDMVGFRAWSISHSYRNRSGLHGAWDVLRDVGVLDTCSTLRAAVRHGQPTIEEMVDRYRLRCRPVRDVLVRYLAERAPGLDFSSLRKLTTTLASTFWADIELHQPGIDTLELPAEVADAWKQRLAHTTKKGVEGRERKGRLDILGCVRSFYLDLQEWAHEDASWAPWAVRSPVRRSELEGVAKRARARTAAVHQRIRERLPHLPVVVDTADRHRGDQAALLAAARAVAVGEDFEHDGVAYRRSVYQWTGQRSSTQHGPDAVLVENTTTGESIDLLRSEADAFWAWAVIEIRHTGVRVEELLEITHLALVSYRLPETGEVVPLLQIIPSKSNEERLLLVTPELASVLAAVIHRIRDADGRVPLIARYDPHERVTGPPLPHLFQLRHGWRRQVMGTKYLYRLLNDTLQRAGLTDRAGQPLRYTPHDFRRIFATDAVTGGLPVHIAAKILGHHNLATTHAYLAVFQAELIQSYRAYLDNRRAYRPAAEYREPTEQEWTEFQKHFELRKLELGTCGRPYGTPCAHEHACIRCPMLRVDPRQHARLAEIAHNLTDRIAEARHQRLAGRGPGTSGQPGSRPREARVTGSPGTEQQPRRTSEHRHAGHPRMTRLRRTPLSPPPNTGARGTNSLTTLSFSVPIISPRRNTQRTCALKWAGLSIVVLVSYLARRKRKTQGQSPAQFASLKPTGEHAHPPSEVTQLASPDMSNNRPKVSIFGLVVILIALTMGWVALRTYENGIVGSPSFPGETSELGDWLHGAKKRLNDDYPRFEVLTSSDVEASTTTFLYFENDETLEGRSADLLLSLSPNNGGEHFVALIFYGDALVDDVEFISADGVEFAQKFDIREDGNADNVLVQVFIMQFNADSPNLMYTSRQPLIRMESRKPYMMRENARISARTPQVRVSGGSCLMTQLESKQRTLPLSQRSRREARQDDCWLGGSYSQKGENLVAIELGGQPYRYEYTSHEPFEVPTGQPAWFSPDGIVDHVRASMVLVDKEARGQQLIFISGIAAGFAAGLLPIGLDSVYKALRSGNPRRSSGSGRRVVSVT